MSCRRMSNRITAKSCCDQTNPGNKRDTNHNSHWWPAVGTA